MNIFSRTHEETTLWQNVLLVFGGAILLFAASQIEIPLKPVPVTLQTVAVMLIGLTYSPRRAVEAHLLWLGAAAVGLPVLTGFEGGIVKLTGPTGGYLFGMVVATYSMALLKQKLSLNSLKSDALLILMGTAIVFFFGVAWLAHLIGFEGAVMHGFVPFIIPGIVKAGVLCAALQALRSRSA